MECIKENGTNRLLTALKLEAKNRNDWLWSYRNSTFSNFEAMGMEVYFYDIVDKMPIGNAKSADR